MCGGPLVSLCRLAVSQHEVLPCENHPDRSSILPGRHAQPRAVDELAEAERVCVCLWSLGWSVAVRRFGG